MRKKINLWNMVLLFVVFLNSPVIFADNPSHSDTLFYQKANQFLDHYYFPVHPSLATELGLHQYDTRLEDYSKEGVKQHVVLLKKYAASLSKISEKNLSEQAQGDYELILNTIRSELLTLESIRPWEKNPDYYSSGVSLDAFVLIERQFASPEARLQALIAREKGMPEALQAARVNIKNPPKIYTQIALEQLPGIIKFFQSDVPKAFSAVHDPKLSKQFATSNSAVIKALFDYQAWLKKDVLPKSDGDFRLGAEIYRQKLKYDEMVTLPLDQLLALNLENMRQNQQEFARIAKELAPNRTPEQMLAAINQNHPAPDKLLTAFKDKFSYLIDFIQQKKIITIPSPVRPIMEETPPFLRAITFASMDTPGPFEAQAKEAYFNVTLPETNWSKDKTDSFMGQFNYPSINSIAIHEAYPGHYVQFLWMHDVHDRIRKVLGAMSNAEGWAHYCEQMMLDEGLQGKDERDTKFLRLGELLNALLRNARFTVSIQMHTGKMTFDEAVDYFVKEGYLSPVAAMIEAKRGTTDPMYLYYTLGKLQILKLRADLEKKEGSTFNLQQFHDDFMRQGFPPIKIVRKALLHNDSATL